MASPVAAPPDPCTSGDVDETFANFSNFGADVDIAAPAVCVPVLWYKGGLANFSGTSLSTPHVTGAAALYLAANPNATPNDVRTWLLTTASRPQGSAVGFTGDPDAFPEPVLHLGP
jgi:subtilisin family serine protease